MILVCEYATNPRYLADHVDVCSIRSLHHDRVHLLHPLPGLEGLLLGAADDYDARAYVPGQLKGTSVGVALLLGTRRPWR